jgi:mRNA interferase HicA
MKRSELLSYLRSQGCDLLREGGNHSWWHNPALNKRSVMPRHSEVKDILVRKIYKDLGIAPVK